jgi:hypothetical protein
MTQNIHKYFVGITQTLTLLIAIKNNLMLIFEYDTFGGNVIL